MSNRSESVRTRDWGHVTDRPQQARVNSVRLQRSTIGLTRQGGRHILSGLRDNMISHTGASDWTAMGRVYLRRDPESAASLAGPDRPWVSCLCQDRDIDGRIRQCLDACTAEGAPLPSVSLRSCPSFFSINPDVYRSSQRQPICCYTLLCVRPN